MKKTTSFLIAVLVLASFIINVLPVEAQRPDFEAATESLTKGRLLVGLEPGVDADTTLGSFGILVKADDPVAGILKEHGVVEIRVKPGSETQAATQIQTQEGIRYVEPIIVYRQARDPIIRDPAYPDEWNLDQLWWEPAWVKLLPDVIPNPVTIAVLDSGYDLGHLDQPTNIRAEADTNWVYPGQLPTEEPCYHGTPVTGIMGAPVNWWGSVGVFPDGIYLVEKVGLNVEVGGENFCVAASNWVAAAIYDAVDRNARIINYSYFGYSPNQTVADAIEYARGQGTIFVTASGNDGYQAASWPCSHPDAVCITGITSNNQLYNFSNWGYAYFNAAGLNRTSCEGPSYCLFLGTSGATPNVAAAIGLIDSLGNYLTVEALLQHVADTARGPKDPPGTPAGSRKFGAGTPNLYAGLGGEIHDIFLPVVTKD